MMLDELITQHKLNHGTHDRLINVTKNNIEISNNILTVAYNAYYKIKNKLGLTVEGDIDLLQLLYNSSDYEELFDYREVSFGDSTLLLYEMKSRDSTRNYHKALKQLKKSKGLILNNTDYSKIDCFYVFNLNDNGSSVVRYEQV